MLMVLAINSEHELQDSTTHKELHQSILEDLSCCCVLASSMSYEHHTKWPSNQLPAKLQNKCIKEELATP
jgi:hypothetical protein